MSENRIIRKMVGLICLGVAFLCIYMMVKTDWSIVSLSLQMVGFIVLLNLMVTCVLFSVVLYLGD